MFRADINALRFIAVISVLLFHFKIPFFLGGYAGVDIFFVISGFLMNQILSKGEINAASTLQFYKKRFNRIFPALCIVATATAASWLIILPPIAFRSTLVEFFSGISFTSNIYYLNSLSGYFSESADSMPFLHTWSLGVEFQFYILFPFLLVVINRFRANKFIVFSTLAALSFIACMFMSKHNSNISFFLLPFRAWELLIGAMVSSCGSINISRALKKTIEITCTIGLIVFVALADQPVNWPDFKATIPCLLTALIILANVDNDHVMLKSGIFQSIGKWSYSIYLVHWPIVSLIYISGLSGNSVVNLIGVIFSLALGWASYRWVEQNSSIYTGRKLALSAALITIISLSGLLSISTIWHDNKALTLDRYSEYAKTDIVQQQFSSSPGRNCFLTMSTPGIEYFNKDYCLDIKPGSASILLIGDSHAAQFSNAIRRANPGASVVQITASGCPPIPKSKGSKYCVDLINYAFNDFIKGKRFDLIIAASDWDVFMQSNDIPKGIVRANEIFMKSSKNVIFIGQTKKYESSLVKILLMGDSPMEAAEKISSNSIITRETINKLSDRVRIVDLFSYGCSDGVCNLYNEDYEPIYFDNNHFTDSWAVKIASQLLKL